VAKVSPFLPGRVPPMMIAIVSIYRRDAPSYVQGASDESKCRAFKN
jgi:hypothetical protein